MEDYVTFLGIQNVHYRDFSDDDKAPWTDSIESKEKPPWRAGAKDATKEKEKTSDDESDYADMPPLEGGDEDLESIGTPPPRDAVRGEERPWGGVVTRNPPSVRHPRKFPRYEEEDQVEREIRYDEDWGRAEDDREDKESSDTESSEEDIKSEEVPKPVAQRQHRSYDPAEDGEEIGRRIGPSAYTAMEIHGFFGLIDDGSDSIGRVLIVHVPKWIRGYFMDINDGDVIHAVNVTGKGGGVLRVLATGRHRYYSPGQRVTTCTVCVPEEQWARVAGVLR
jgi:hypothetical protein